MSNERFKIVENSTRKGSYFLTDTKKEYENIGVDNPNDSTVKHLLYLVNNFDNKDYNLVAVHDYIIGLERSLILVEKLQQEFDYVARRNFNEDDKSYREKVEYQFLMIGDDVIDNHIKKMWCYIECLRKELGFKSNDNVEGEVCEDSGNND